MERMRPPRVPKQVIQPFSQDDIRRMLVVLGEGTFRGHRNTAIILTFLDTGLRLSELAGIMLNEVDFDNGIIKVMGKGRKERFVRVGKEAQRAILRYLLKRNDDLPCLWVTEERRPMKFRGIQVMVKRLGQRAGLKNVRCSPHTFRHTWAPAMLKLGIDMRTLQRLLGHSTLTMTLIYVESVDSEQAIERCREVSPVDDMK